MSALNKKSFLTYLKEGGIYVVLLVLLAIIIFQDPTFLSLLNLSNILTQSSVRIIIALGVGTVIGVVTGVIIFTVINYGLTYIGVNPYWQYIIKGAIIIFAVALDSLKYARKK